jgi:hypothetical protein
MFEAARLEPCHNLDRFVRHLFDNSAFDPRKIKRLTAQYDYRFLPIRPFAECHNELVCLPPDNNDIHTAIEFLETVGHLLACVQEVNFVIRPSKKAIDAYSAEDREFHGPPPDFRLV